ncbi:MAG TPA: hypothetical protein VFS40_00605 [Gemmatimonadales bacterium]|nr:hypothetical protein [Gemmatimonadales bacterium]
MTGLERSLLRTFAEDSHTFAPTTITTTAYAWFNDTVAPALERLATDAYLVIEERAPNRLFSPGGRFASYACRLTPAGHAARALLRKERESSMSIGSGPERMAGSHR